MNNGKVLVVAGSGNDPTVSNYQAGVWDPETKNDGDADASVGHVLQWHGLGDRREPTHG